VALDDVSLAVDESEIAAVRLTSSRRLICLSSAAVTAAVRSPTPSFL
jgi:hypothetical protein